jgi:hypothetical protein
MKGPATLTSIHITENLPIRERDDFPHLAGSLRGHPWVSGDSNCVVVLEMGWLRHCIKGPGILQTIYERCYWVHTLLVNVTHGCSTVNAQLNSFIWKTSTTASYSSLSFG